MLFSGGMGTRENPYYVATPNDLDAVRNNLSAHYIQVADIDLSEWGNWEPIGSTHTIDYVIRDTAFSGLYDGNGKTISNMTIIDNRVIPPEFPFRRIRWGVGLFSLVTGELKNIILHNCNVTGISNPNNYSLAYDLGALVGLLHGSIQQCSASGSVSTGINFSWAGSTGGIGGLIGNTNVSHLYYDPEGTGVIEVDQCFSSCSVFGDFTQSGGGSGIGGLLGYARADSSYYNHRFDVTLIDCYATGNVVGKYHSNNSIGGLVGFAYSGTAFLKIKRCYSIGQVEDTMGIGDRTGGLIGSITIYVGGGTVDVAESYYDLETSGQNDTGKGEPKTTIEMKRQSTFINWDFGAVWMINLVLNKGYPFFRWQLPKSLDEVIPKYPPASYVQLQFRTGDSTPYSMGRFFIDRTNFRVGDSVIKMDLRNTIGKYLADQSFDERNFYNRLRLDELFKSILVGAGITNYYVGVKANQVGMEFPPNMKILEGVIELLKTIRNWQIREEANGKVVIAARTDSAFTQPSKYTFHRNRDVFSRQQRKDDNQTYGRVCVHDREFNVKIYRSVSSTLGWLPPAQKTLYVEAPEGTTTQDSAALATEIAESLRNSGEIEQFVGPFRPQLIPGDEAEIMDQDGPNLLGIITTVVHRFGKRGFYTEMTIDSGGSIGRPRLKDYLDEIAAKTQRGRAKRIY